MIKSLKGGFAMRTIDFSPLFRHSVGFDRMQRLLDAASQTEQNSAYPPYNIEQLGENGYQVTLAVAGFAEGDIDITLTDRTLVVSGKMSDGEGERNFLYRGIAGRAFERRFELADHIHVKGASLENGLLHVALERVVPESEKPRKIEIAATSGAKAIEQKAA
jgi:molecular chaperone IbpA